MTDRLTKTFVQTAMVNTTKALRDAKILHQDEYLEMRDSGGVKFPINLVVMGGTPAIHRTTIASDANLHTTLTALEALRNLAHLHRG